MGRELEDDNLNPDIKGNKENENEGVDEQSPKIGDDAEKIKKFLKRILNNFL